jgi:hypothetical protein
MSSTPLRSSTPALRATLTVAAIVIAIVVNTGVALLAKAVDSGGTRTGLILVAYGPLTTLGILAGTAGWATVRHYAGRPRAVLRVLVPAVVAASFVPGVIQLTLGTSPVNVAALWVMHLVVAVVTVATASRVFPLAD